jgi:hypothetical protein
MKAIDFEESNLQLGKDQQEYETLPVLRMDSERREMISCWQLSFTEKLRVLFTGKIWLNVLTFNNPFQPVLLTTKRTDLFTVAADHWSWWKKLTNKLFK